MVFKTRPYRQSAFLSADQFSVAKAEIQQDNVFVFPLLKNLAKCSGCRIYDDHIEFDAGGQLTLPLAPLMPAMIADLHVQLDGSKTPSSTALQYQILHWSGAVRFAGTLAPVNAQDVLRIPVYVVDSAYLTLSSQAAAAAYFSMFRISRVTTGIVNFVLPAPTAYLANLLQPWFHSRPPNRYWVCFFWRSADGQPATLTYRESGVEIATFSTTSTNIVCNGVGRAWARDIDIGYSASSNAVVHRIAPGIHFYGVLGSIYTTKSVQSSYSTTSTTYVQNTPLSLTSVRARIRKIVVSASSNAKWYVEMGGNKVLDSSWGLTSIDLNPPNDAARINLWLASADGTNATATIIIIYDEYPGLP
jgi:hypothetical protein